MLELIIYIITMAITPGPNTILSMANAASVGLRKGIRLNIGMLIGITAVTAIAWLLSEFVYMVLPQAETAMRVLAAAYLLYLAWKMLRQKDIEDRSGSTTLLQGMLLQLVNFKVYLLALTAISAYIMPMTESTAETLLISSMIPLICFVSGLVWAVCGSLLKNLYSRYRKLFSAIFALALLWCAFRMFQ